MDEKLKNDKKVMLVQDAKDGKLKGVTDLDKKGNIQTCDLTEGNISNLLNVNTHESALETFFKKFMQEAENPSHTGIFMMAQNVFDRLMKMDFNPDELEKHRVDPAEGQKFQPMDIEKIDLADMERNGIKPEDIEPYLNAMSYGYKSNQLVNMNPEIGPGGIRVSTQGRVSLEEQPDGSIKVIPHYRQESPNLDAPLHGVLLEDKVKNSLLETGHAGQVVDLELTPGKREPCYVTLDNLTNALEVMPVADFPKRDELKDVKLTEGQQLDLYSGKKVLLEGFTTRAGYKRDGYIQINASDRNFHFTFDGLDRTRYAEENKKITIQKRADGQTTGNSQSQGRVRSVLLGVTLDEKTQNTINARESAYIKGMVKDGGKPFSRWVKFNDEGELKFYKYDPDYHKKKGQNSDQKQAQQPKTPPSKRQTPSNTKKAGGPKV